MTLSSQRRYYDDQEALVDQRVFADRGIYRAELTTMFDRAWLFVGPANWLARAGDYTTSLMGNQGVLGWRGAQDKPRVFVNRCPWGNEALTSEARGNASVLHCDCHGRAYTPDDAFGALDAVPHVTTYRGLVFANRDPDARPFETWLSDFAWYLDLFLPETGVEAWGGDSLRWTIETNWKLPMLTGCGEVFDDPAASDEGDADGAQISLGGGALAVRRTDNCAGDDPRDGFSPLYAALFPNLLFDRDRHSMDVVHPIGPTRCEVHSYCLVDAGATPTDRETARRRFQFLSGPAGINQSIQARHWENATAAARAGRHRGQQLSLRMGLGKERPSNLPGSFAPFVSEANQRAFFFWWQAQLTLPAHAARQSMRIR